VAFRQGFATPFNWSCNTRLSANAQRWNEKSTKRAEGKGVVFYEKISTEEQIRTNLDLVSQQVSRRGRHKKAAPKAGVEK
jgi:hypothetical protein